MALVNALHLATLSGVPETVLRLGAGGANRTVDLPIFSFLVTLERSSETVVFDLGCPPPHVASERGHHQVKDHRTIGAALRDRGVDPSTVGVLVLSHLHWDHCYGLDELPNAEVLVQRAELQYAFAPFLEHSRSYDAFEIAGRPDWLDHLDRIRPVDGSVRLSEEARLVPLPGHTPGSQGLVVDCSAQTGQPVVCCGDHVVTYANLGSGAPRVCGLTAVPPGLLSDPSSWRLSTSRIADEGWIPLPAHEARVVDVLAGGMDSARWSPRASATSEGFSE